MKTFYLAFAVIFCVALTAIAEEENDIIFRALIENLCQANRLGAYGSCCDENSNGTTVTVSSLAGCFCYVSLTGSEITRLALSGRGLTTIPSGAFVNLTGLRSLFLEQNSLTTLVSGTFEGLNSLASLDLRSSSISEIEGGAFNGLSNLGFLNLNGNTFTKLVSGTFAGLSNLGSLYLASMSISEIEGGAFNGLSNLASLNLNGNTFTKLVSGTFAGLSNLASLYLASMSISEIEGGAFNGLNNLASLGLYGNSLTVLVTGTFSGLDNLAELYLGYSSISEIEGGAFNGLNNLVSLGLNGNSLTVLVTGTFSGLENLRSLYIDNNNIVYLEENIFGANTQVPSKMPIYNNRLLFLPKSFSSGTTSVPYMDVEHNCLDCSLYPSPQYNLDFCSSSYQSTGYCPTDTNNCPTYNKFKLDHCFNCSTNSDDAFCDICMPGYKHTESGCGCVKCEEGDSCEFGEPRKPDSSCASCTSVTYSSASVCSSCAAKYKYVNGDCAACGNNECCPGGGSGSTYISNCTKCTDDQLGCLSCEVGTKYVRNVYYSYGRCAACGENECCLGGNLTETCAECLEDMSGCKTCHAKRRPENGECVWGDYGECWPEGRDPSQKIEHCISCREDDDGCALCEKEYRNQDGVCVEKNKYKSMSIMNHVHIGIACIVVFIMSMIGML